jgi:hypothetical protein
MEILASIWNAEERITGGYCAYMLEVTSQPGRNAAKISHALAEVEVIELQSRRG